MRCDFKMHTRHGLLLKLVKFNLPYFASSANECQHCWEGTCDGLVSRPGGSV